MTQAKQHFLVEIDYLKIYNEKFLYPLQLAFFWLPDGGVGTLIGLFQKKKSQFSNESLKEDVFIEVNTEEYFTLQW